MASSYGKTSVKAIIGEMEHPIFRLSAFKDTPPVEYVKNLAKHTMDMCKKKEMCINEAFLKTYNEQQLMSISTEVIASTSKPKERCHVLAEIIYQPLIEQLENQSQQSEKAKELLLMMVQAGVWNDFADAGSNVSWASFSERFTKELQRRSSPESKVVSGKPDIKMG